MSPPLVGMDLADLREALGPGQPEYRARQLYEALYRGRASGLPQVSTLPAGLRQALAERYSMGLPEIARRYESADGTRRYLLRLEDGRNVETVLMPEGERDTICISSQVGCAVDCAFCMTALLGLQRNLTAGEIVGQILAVLNDQQVELASDRINLVFMGQGEPFLNYDNFMHAVHLLVEAVGIPESRMTVSTSGIIPRIIDFGAEPVRPKLAVSLNAPNETLRTQIMPITKKWTIEKLMAALREFPLRNRERLTFEY